MPDRACDLCGLRADSLERHHLIPRTRHRNKRNKKRFEREDVRTRLAMLCTHCHDMVHATLSPKELEDRYNTLDALRGHPRIEKFVQWIRKHPPRKHLRTRRGKGDDLDRRRARKESQRRKLR